SATGLYATATVFTSLLAGGPTPQRLVATLPALTWVMVSFAAPGLLDSAVEAARGALTPRGRHAPQDELAPATPRSHRLAWEDGVGWRERARRGGRQGAVGVENSVRRLPEIPSCLVSRTAALVTAGILNAWLLPVLLLAAAGDAWVSMSLAKLGYEHFLAM